MTKDEFQKAVDDVIEDCIRNDYSFGSYARKVTDAVWPVLEAAEKERDELKRACFGHISDNSLLRAEIARLQKETDKFGDGIDWIQRALQAEAQIEALKQQKPIAWMSSRNGFICKENKNPEYNVPLKRFDLGAQTQGEEK